MEKYVYSGGHFVNVGNTNWQEWQQKQLIFHFKETERDNGWITLYDASRNIWVALPKGGGKSYYAWGGDSDWTELYEVRRDYGAHLTSKRQTIIDFALQHIGWQNAYKPTAKEISEYYEEAQVVTDGRDILPAITNAVNTNRSIRLWNQDSQWCGILATCILRRAGLLVKWGPAKNGWGIVDSSPTQQVKIERGYAGIEPGDVGVIEHHIHHFVVTKVGNKYIDSVDGNQEHPDNPSIIHYIRKRKRRITDVWYYYKVL